MSTSASVHEAAATYAEQAGRAAEVERAKLAVDIARRFASRIQTS